MNISTINSILFTAETKPQTAAEVKPNADTKAPAKDAPQLKEPLKKDTVEIKNPEKPEVKCEGDACKCTGENCKKA